MLDQDRFQDRLETRFKSRLKVDESGCWLWAGALDDSGYGKFTVKFETLKASRFSWAFHFGNIPDGMLVLHKCDVRACCNPLHLYLGTQKQNIADMHSRGRGPKHRNRPYGEKSGSNKLTWPQVRSIRKEYNLGASVAELATRYGMSRSPIYAIVNDRGWRE